MKFFCCGRPNSCPVPKEESASFAQYAVAANPATNSFLPFMEKFIQGEGIKLVNDTTIEMKEGYLYQISYLFLATPEANSYMEVVPFLNGTMQRLYSFYAPTGASYRNASASGSFTVFAKEDTELSIQTAYSPQVRNLDITGAVSVTALKKIQ